MHSSSTEHGTVKSYILGLILSLMLTGAAYFIVSERLLAGWPLVLTAAGLGCLQAIIQLLLFLHLGEEGKPHWNLLVFLFMALVLLMVVFGSLWIMYHLNYQMM